MLTRGAESSPAHEAVGDDGSSEAGRRQEICTLSAGRCFFSEGPSKKQPEASPLTPCLCSQDWRDRGRRATRRCSPPRSFCPRTSPLKRTPPLPPHRPSAGARRCRSTPGWRRCSNKCTGGSHDPMASPLLPSQQLRVAAC